LTLLRAANVFGFAAVLFLAIPGSTHPFSIPRLVVLTSLAALQVPAVFLLGFREIPRASRAVRVFLLMIAGVAVVVVVQVLVAPAPRVAAIVGVQSRFIAAAVLLAGVLTTIGIWLATRKGGGVRFALLLLSIGVVGVGAHAGLQALGIDPQGWVLEGSRAVGTFGNSNFVGGVAALGAPLSAWLWVDARRQRWFSGIVGLAVVVAILASEARLGAVAAVIGLGAYALAARPRSAGRLQGWLIAAAPAGAVLAGSVVVAIAAALGDANGIIRISGWRTAARMATSDPWLGQGLGRFEPAQRRFRTVEEVTAFGQLRTDVQVDSSHHLLLDLAATAGLPAAVLWVALLVGSGLLVRVTWQHASEGRRPLVAAVLGVLAAHSAQAAISVPTISSMWLGFAVLGLVLALASPVPRASRPRRPRGDETLIHVTAGAIALGLLLAGVLALPGGELHTAARSVHLAETALAGGDPGAAVAAAERATDLAPWWPEGWLARARAARALDDFEEAHAAADQAVLRDPKDRFAIAEQVAIALAVGDDAAAEAGFERLVALDPYGPGLHIERLRWAQQTGRSALAAESAALLERTITAQHVEWDRYQAALR